MKIWVVYDPEHATASLEDERGQELSSQSDILGVEHDGRLVMIGPIEVQ